MATGAEDNGRVTMALLADRLDRLTATVQALTIEVKESNKCLNAMAVNNATNTERLDNVTDEVKALRTRSNWSDGGIAALSIMAAAIAAWLGIKR